MQYAVFLRGINVGGNKRVEMKKLKEMLEGMGFTSVSTLLNSGNVVFSADEKDSKKLKSGIEEKLQSTFGFPIPTILRTETQLKDLMKADPFQGIEVTDATRLYVTFLSEPVKSSLPLPYSSPEGNLQILRVTNTEIISIVTVSQTGNTTDLMKVLEKEFGKEITTRNWNTLQKLVSLL